MALLMNNEQLNKLYNTILHRGLKTYKAKGSKAPFRLRMEVEERHNKQGAIFAVRSKEDFTPAGVKGYIITSKETLIEDVSSLSHFTPNVYRTFGYADAQRRYIIGFEEKNLLQINTFVVDIDTKRHSVQDILLACIDDSIGAPTLIVETNRGYQVYFVLSSPLYISNKKDYLSLKVAKRIADNLKRSLKGVDADPFCNDFGFFRVPKPENIVWLQLENTYEIAQLIDWSMRQDADLNRPLFVVPSKITTVAATQSDWFHALIQATHIKGGKGRIGRNNAMFTLALVCFSEGWDKTRTFDLLDEYNSRLQHPLSVSEVNTILESAYSGKYQGAKREYIEELLSNYIDNSSSIEVSFPKKGWYKFKKERKNRSRTHYYEWEKDIIQYISEKKSPSEMFLWLSQKELCQAIGIPQSTLNEVLKRSTKIIKTVNGKGRNAKTGWTTVPLFIASLVQQAKELAAKKSAYRVWLQTLVEEWIDGIEPIGGYEILLDYLEALGFSNIFNHRKNYTERSG